MKKPAWDDEIRELEEFYSGEKLPEKIKLKSWEMIVDTRLFLESHFAMVRYHNGEEAYRPYLNRLIETKKIIENGQK